MSTLNSRQRATLEHTRTILTYLDQNATQIARTHSIITELREHLHTLTNMNLIRDSHKLGALINTITQTVHTLTAEDSDKFHLMKTATIAYVNMGTYDAIKSIVTICTETMNQWCWSNYINREDTVQLMRERVAAAQ